MKFWDILDSSWATDAGDGESSSTASSLAHPAQLALEDGMVEDHERAPSDVDGVPFGSYSVHYLSEEEIDGDENLDPDQEEHLMDDSISPQEVPPDDTTPAANNASTVSDEKAAVPSLKTGVTKT